MNMEKIHNFNLTNKGGFVVKMEILYGGNTGEDEQGNLRKFESGTWTPDGYHDICAAGERLVDLSKTNIPNGAEVKLKVIVCGGRDKTSDSFIYSKTSPVTKYFKITGTTLINKLKEE